MSNGHPKMTKADERWLESASPSAIEEKLCNGNANSSATDWMLTVPQKPKTRPDQKPVTEEEITKVLKALKVTYYVFQLEKGEKTGYLHFQIFFQRSSKTLRSTISRAFEKADIALGWAGPRKWWVSSCIKYCSKPDTREGQTVEWGEPTYYGSDKTEADKDKITLETLRAMVNAGATVEDLLTSPDPKIQKAATIHAVKLQRLEAALNNKRWSTKKRQVKVFYLWGKTRTGKTTLARDKAGESIYCVTSYQHPFDHYNYQKNLLLDDFRDSRLSLVEMLHVLDSQPMQLDCRYFNKFAAWDTVWITSNLPPESLYLNADADSRDALLARITEVWKVEEDTVKVYETEQHSRTKSYTYQDKKFIQVDQNNESDDNN